MDTTGNSESMIQDVLGCGLFQGILVVSVCLFCKMSVAFTLLFTAFGNYNPGWRCTDDLTSSISTTNHTTMTGVEHGIRSGFSFSIIQPSDLGINTSWTSRNDSRFNMHNAGNYVTDGHCKLFDSCRAIQFNPESSTIISEWSLLCGKGWISSLIISVQMFGVLIGSSIAGIMADAFGRKTMLYSSQIFTVVFNAAAAFSVSWQMFAAFRFLLGCSVSFHSTLYYVYCAEFLTKRWRAILAIMPWYPLNSILAAVMCWFLRDWRHLHISTAVVSLIGLLSAFWVPESLRWLEIKEKRSEYESTVRKIAKFNGKLLNLDNITLGNHESKLETNMNQNKETKYEKIRVGLQIFGKQYRKFTAVVALVCLSMGIIHYAINFGIKALSGNFYTNLIILYSVETLLDCGVMFVPNILGRRKSGVIFAGFAGLCLLCAACFNEVLSSSNTKTFGVTAFVMAGNIALNGMWSVMQVFIVELYPTIIRGVAASWGCILIRIGGILAPLLIPKDSSSFFECYMVMGILGLVCAMLIVFLPETKGKALEDRLNEKQKLYP